MKFKAQLADLNAALSLVAIVKPAEDPSGQSGYLLVAKGETCFLYSEDEHQKSRVNFPIYELDEEGALVLPAKALAPLSCLEGEVTLQSSVEEGAHMVSYDTEGEASQKMPTFDPRTLQALDKDLEGAQEQYKYPTVLLKDAIAQVRPFLADAKDPKVKDTHKCLHVFDSSKPEWEKGNGVAFGTTGVKACFYYCGDFKDHGLTLHGLRIPLLMGFLSKSSGEVTLKKSDTSTYFINEAGQVIGWSDAVVPHKKFDFYPLKSDTHVLRVTKSIMVKALEYVRKSLDPKQDRVRFEYDHERKMVRLRASDNGVETASPPVGVTPLTPEEGTEDNPVIGGEKSKEESFSCNFSVNNLMEMLSPARNHQIELRVSPYQRKPGAFLFRTIEVYTLDSNGKVVLPGEENTGKVHQCQVTRFSPSRA